MQIFKDIKSIKTKIKDLKKSGKTIALVPTMGFLHEGHLALINEAQKNADIVITSIFVNQKQFNNQSDFENYPNNLQQDTKKLKANKVDILFCPKADEIYPNQNFINFKIDKLTNNLCGKYRENHFEGVCLVISKLFNIIEPDFAVFGQKDFQQLQLIKQLVKDLNFDIKIISAPTLREKNGLALSSRNARLSAQDNKKAANIYKILENTKTNILTSKNLDLAKELENTKNKLLKYFDKIDYLDICDEENLQKINKFDNKIKSRIFVALYCANVRLIDNIKLH